MPGQIDSFGRDVRCRKIFWQRSGGKQIHFSGGKKLEEKRFCFVKSQCQEHIQLFN